MLRFLSENLGLLTVVAIFTSPLVALVIQKKIEEFNDKTRRKLNIFKTLLATQGSPASIEHVQSLNLIEVEFYDEEEITNSWDLYLTHLNSYPKDPTGQAISDWHTKRIEYIFTLLSLMSKSLGYEINIKKGVYAPVAHAQLDDELSRIRKGVLQVLNSEKSIKIDISSHL